MLGKVLQTLSIHLIQQEWSFVDMKMFQISLFLQTLLNVNSIKLNEIVLKLLILYTDEVNLIRMENVYFTALRGKIKWLIKIYFFI